MPERIRLSRAKGWRKPADAVVVARPTRWGNPYALADYTEESGAPVDKVVARERSVRDFRRDLLAGRLPGYPGVAEIRRDLGGRDLACWCPLGGPCHADVLLEIANSTG
jgi:hypothetical protein